VTNLNRLFKWLAILSTLIALVVFLFSIVNPFYSWALIGLASEGATYWSYRGNQWFVPDTLGGVGSHNWQFWFSNYWFNASNQYDPMGFWNLGISGIPISLFVMQILTLAFGCASIVIDRRVIQCLPVCTSLTVLGLMFYMGYRLSSFNNFGQEYELGYYLVYPSVALFALAFVLTAVRTKYLRPKEPKTNYNFS
jgi:hypothetical protein